AAARGAGPCAEATGGEAAGAGRAALAGAADPPLPLSSGSGSRLPARTGRAAGGGARGDGQSDRGRSGQYAGAQRLCGVARSPGGVRTGGAAFRAAVEGSGPPSAGVAIACTRLPYAGEI